VTDGRTDRNAIHAYQYRAVRGFIMLTRDRNTMTMTVTCVDKGANAWLAIP